MTLVAQLLAGPPQPVLKGVDRDVLIEMWSDVVCPWCYIGKRRVETALSRFPHTGAVRMRWRSFQLDPAAPRSLPDEAPGTTRQLVDKYGISPEQARAMNERVTAVAAAEGLDFRLDAARGTNTMDAHRLLHEAAVHGAQDALKERLLHGYFTEGERIDDRDALLRIAIDAGVPGPDAAAVLDSDGYADRVRDDQAEAAALGARAVPFLAVDRRYGVAGAESPEVFASVLDKAWAERTS